MLRPFLGEKRIVFFLLDEFSLHAISGALTVLRLANETSGRTVYSWRMVSHAGGSVRSACGLEFASDAPLEEEMKLLQTTQRPSMIVISGGHRKATSSREIDTWVRECALRRIPVATLAGGVFIPAGAGLYRGNRWAVHWEHYPAFAESFPELCAAQNIYEIDGDLLSCAGGDAAFDMFLRFVEGDLGSPGINRICEIAMVNRVRSSGERQRLPLQIKLGITHCGVLRVIEQMEENLDQPLRLDKLAPASGLSRRQIERLFLQYFGRTPGRYYLELRLEKADLLIKHLRLPITEIAVACGFVSGSHFTKPYRSRYGRTPQQQRTAAMGESALPSSGLVGASAAV
ncbi:GlxA family transcriptional regulator [Rhizobium lentis]|uniref:GlxA family transcriptional regulator n=1 Tax=Rhizobium lentis TaxID=1138194 RepID=UPI001C83E87A|nr:GlxA family transcriptional regulator [Rhizobium lentis]MBX5133407.1 GlxA family transcriptional regulator [Rhizobium lentis]